MPTKYIFYYESSSYAPVKNKVQVHARAGERIFFFFFFDGRRRRRRRRDLSDGSGPQSYYILTAAVGNYTSYLI